MGCSGTCTWTLKSGKWVCTDSCSGGCVCVDAIQPLASSPTFDSTDPTLTPGASISSLVQVIDATKKTPITTTVKAFIRGSGRISEFIVDPALMDHRLQFLLGLRGTTKWSDLDVSSKGGNPSATALITAAAPIAQAVARAIATGTPLPAVAGPITLPCMPPQ
jgi:hypothetical protein